MKAKLFYLTMALVMALSLVAVAVPLASPVIADPGTIRVDKNDAACVSTSGQPDPNACVYCNIQAAIADATGGDTIRVAAGTYAETGQIVINNNLTIIGASPFTTVITPTGNTGSSGDARGWFLVNDGITFNLSHVTLDGSGYKIWQGIRDLGQGTISYCTFKNIKYDPSTSYAGVAIAAFGTPAMNVDVLNCNFTQIGRIGILYYGTGVTGSTYSDNRYTGKGPGDWLDYGVEVGAGASVTITRSTISNCRGVASSDGSTSAGILVTTYYGGGTQATITSNTITGCTEGIAVGYDAFDTSSVDAHQNNLAGNDNTGIGSTAPAVDAENNWWGSKYGPKDTTGTTECLNADEGGWNCATCDTNQQPSGQTGVAVSDYVDYCPWLLSRVATTGCFIATAAYGTDTAGQLDVLRAFRDQVLLESTLGSQFVALYYDVSPPIADFIAENDLLRATVRELLIDPIVTLAQLTAGIWGD